MLFCCDAVSLAEDNIDKRDSVEIRAQLIFQVVLNIGQALDQERVERTALAVQDHLERLLVTERLFIAAFAGQGVVDIGY